MIECKLFTARSAPVALAPTTFTLGAGVHALLGTATDGVPLVLAAIAGRVRLRRGSVHVLGQPPAAVRPKVAYVPRDTVLPDALTVDEALDVAADIRGQPREPAAGGQPRAPVAERLAVLGVAALAGRPVRTLTRGEVRAVAMVEAVTSGAPVLLLDEPYASLDPRAVGELRARLRERASAGACVVIGTSSVRDAADIADDQLVFDRGVLVRAFGVESATVPSAPMRPVAHAPPARLSLCVSDAGAFLALLAAEPAIASVTSERSQIVVSGADVTELAQAVGRAVLASGVDLAWMRAETPPLETLRG